MSTDTSENTLIFLSVSAVLVVMLDVFLFAHAGWLDWLGNPLWFTGLATALLAGGVFVALFGLWDAKKTRHGALITDLSRRWDEPGLVESQNLYSEIGPSGIVDLANKVNLPKEIKDTLSEDELAAYALDVKEFSKLLAFPTLLDTIGVLVDEDVLTADVSYKMWGPLIALAWRTWNTTVDGETPVAALRRQWGRQSTYRSRRWEGIWPSAKLRSWRTRPRHPSLWRSRERRAGAANHVFHLNLSCDPILTDCKDTPWVVARDENCGRHRLGQVSCLVAKGSTVIAARSTQTGFPTFAGASVPE